MVRCPECESEIDFEGYELDVGENVNCPECSAELRITSAEPITVALVEN
jgi:lysine biosynthesis protein LysW